MIYFATNGDAIKIGRSRNVQARIKSLSTSSAAPLTLITALDGDAQHEAKVHTELAEYRLNGEWFTNCQKVCDAIVGYQKYGILIDLAEDDPISDEPPIVAECRAAGLKLIVLCERSGLSRMEAYERVAILVGTNAEWLRKFLAGSRSAKEPRLSVGYALLSDAALESIALLAERETGTQTGATSVATVNLSER